MIEVIFFLDQSLINKQGPRYSPTCLYSLNQLKSKNIRLIALTREELQGIEGYFDEIYYLDSLEEMEKKIRDYLEKKDIDSKSSLVIRKSADDFVYRSLVEAKLIPQVELLDAIDKDERLLGFYLARATQFPEATFHLVVEIIVEHTDGSILLMRRSPDKRKAPGLWEASASGSVVAGEKSLDGAKRELREETGIDRGNFSFLGRYIYQDLGAIFHNYHCLTDFDKTKITLQEGETVDFRWIKKEELADFLNSPQAIAWQAQRYKELNLI
ncbi:MAG: NUDIX hydrolase [Tissierellia bacterium]|nr:NUDIX hydrolase [Tissierellia bacterium]